MNSSERVEGRIVKVVRHIYKIKIGNKIYDGEVSGSFHYKVVEKVDYPTIGDRVLLNLEGDLGYIQEVLPRKTKLSRKVSGDREYLKADPREQLIAANMDKVAIVFSIDGSRSLSHGGVDRYVAIAWESGAVPVIILNKLDLCEDLNHIQDFISDQAPGVDVFYTSALDNRGIEEFRDSMVTGESFVFIGPSGAGKSSIINSLIGQEAMETGGLRKGDHQGRHTTTHKEILTLENGSEVMDCPGMREIQIWGDAHSVDEAFSDIVDFASQCRFNNCSHTNEPGCRILEALKKEELKEERLKSYFKLLRELERLELRRTSSADHLEKAKWKKIYQNFKNRDKVVY